MGALFDNVRSAAARDRFFISIHADEQLAERRITAWQVVVGLQTARLIRERPKARPNPAAEADQLLADGTAVKAVWSYVRDRDVTILVTVHFYDR